MLKIKQTKRKVKYTCKEKTKKKRKKKRVSWKINKVQKICVW
jgi:hypothetical protein